MSIGVVIREERTRQRMSQAMLAHRAGLSRNSISNIETDRQNMTMQTLNSIADALETTPEQLMQGDRKMAKREHTLTITVTADSIAILHTAVKLFVDNLADAPPSSLTIPWGELFDLHWAIPDSTPGKAALGRFLDDFAPQVSPPTPEGDND